MSTPILTLCVISFDGYECPKWVRSLLEKGLGGVALFKRNILDFSQVQGLTRSIKHAAKSFPPPIIAIDEEGGKVQRLKDIFPVDESAREIGTKGEDACFAQGQRIGRFMRELGLNTNFAPVLDIGTNENNPIIGDRAFSSDKDVVAKCGIAFARGLEKEGILPCGKHFPGHGDAGADSHLELPVIMQDKETLVNRELYPFAKAIKAGFRLFMTAHCLYPALDEKMPATFSRHILQDILRENLGFEGCVISDDLGMKAVSERFSIEEMVVLGLEAGLDIFLHCGIDGQGEELVFALEKIWDKEKALRNRVEASVARVVRLRQNLF